MNNFYVYIYLDPRKFGRYCYKDICFLYEPIYIGKGKNKRYNDINQNRRNKYFIRKINKIKNFGLEPIVFKLYKNLNENQSFNLERNLIQEIGRYDLNLGTLLNMTDGGEGISGLIFSENHKRKISERNKGRKFSDQHKKKISEIKKEKYKNNEIKKLNGINNPMFGKKKSEETKNKISDKLKGEKHPRHKLTNDKVIQIKLLLKEGKLTQQEIADIFKIKQARVSEIKLEKSWSHIKI